MDSSTRADEKLDSDSTEDNTGRISYGGAIFTGSQHFTVAGGTFTNVTKNFSAPQAVSADFARIHMGDIDLQREIWWNPHGHSRVGHGSEEEWRCDIAKYMAVRHPNIVQLYGTASCSNMHAVVFTDDLIPFQQFANLYQHSHFATVYIRAYVDTEFYSGIISEPFLDTICGITTVHSSYVAPQVGSARI
ncbi:hypothetical protein MSAN_00299600 [Mycena sanguinolenta]|uniref:Uncharacterized protein n=1 Tax=Mycena sanguinolenta TaxID=230812 RepID=A0A8H6Z7W8_9AGAR|nr:hypothetical protein MSAN_00299600 [Mycena sanguinolenta]